jgi:hypothetical protein
MPVITTLGSLHQQTNTGSLTFFGNWIGQFNGAGYGFSYFDSTASQYTLGNPVAKVSTTGVLNSGISYNSGLDVTGNISNTGTFAQTFGAGYQGNTSAINKASYVYVFKSPNIGIQLTHFSNASSSGMIGGPQSVISETANIAYVSGTSQFRPLQLQRPGYVIKITDTTKTWETDFYPANGNAAISAAFDTTTMSLCNGVPIAAGKFTATYTANSVVIDNGFIVALNTSNGAATWTKAYVSGTVKIYPTAPVQIGTTFFSTGANTYAGSPTYIMTGSPTTGNITASRIITGGNTITKIYPDPASASNLYVQMGKNDFVKMTTGFTILYQRRFIDAGNIGITSITGDTGSNIFINSGNVVMKVPSDGTIPQSGTYNITSNTYIYSNINTTYAMTTSNVASANSLVVTNSGFSPGYTAIGYGVSQPGNVIITTSIVSI